MQKEIKQTGISINRHKKFGNILLSPNSLNNGWGKQIFSQ